MDLVATLRSTGAARSFTDEPVPDATLHAVLDVARYAPSGGNRQPWRIAIVRDPAVRRALADLMQPVWDEYSAYRKAGFTPYSAGAPPSMTPIPTVNPLLETIETIPVMLVVAADRRDVAVMDGRLDRPPITSGASIYPFCWNLLLAAREHGLGGVMTTFMSRVEPAAAPLLGLPPDHAIAATVFLGHPVTQPTKLTRRPVDAFTRFDRFDGAPFHG